MSKKVISLLIALLMVFSAFACTATEAPAAEAPAAAESTEVAQAPAEQAATEEHTPVTLEVSIVETDWLDAWENEMKPAFEAEYPWITLEAVSLGEEKRDFHTTRAAANDLPPVMQTDVGGLYYEFVDEGMILDLSSYDVAANIPQSYKDAYTYNGTLYGLTQGAAFDAIYYNMKILEEAGWTVVPANWDEFIKCCADIKAAGYEALTVAGAKNTTMWMPFETIMLNVIGDTLGQGVYEEQIRNGSLDLTAFPAIAERLDQIAQYMMPGSTTNSEDDVTAIMTDGTCGIAIAGNWTANNICSGITTATGDESYARMTLIPFNDAGKDVWLAATPESAFGLAKVDDENLVEARDIFFNWLFQPENFKYIQNARGTLPVLSTMTSEQVVLPDAVKAFSAETGNAISFSMSFNNITGQVNNDVQAALGELFTGNANGADTIAKIQALYSADPINP